MRKILLICLLFLSLSTHAWATDVTWADKSTGGTFSAADANEVKTAVNSKANLSRITWVTATAYTANNTMVAHGGHVFICTSNHTAGSATEPGVGASWATVWKYHGSDLYLASTGTAADSDKLGGVAAADYQLSLGTVGAAGLYPIEETALGVTGKGIVGNWKMFYSNAAGGNFEQFDIGTSGYSLVSQGTAGAPQWLIRPQTITCTSTDKISAFDITTGLFTCSDDDVGSGSMTWPSAAGIAVYDGSSAWGSSLTLDTDISSVSASDDSVPSAKATKTALDLKANATGISFLASALSDMKILDAAQPVTGQALVLDTLAYANADDALHVWSIDKVGSELAGKQASDSDLTALAALTTTATGLSILDDTTTGAMLTTLGLTANGQSLVTAANYAAMRTLLDLESGTDFNAYDADIADLADGSLTASKVAGSAVATGSKATTYTIGTDSANESYGGTIYITSATTITAPAVVAGMNFSVVAIGDIAVSLDVNASDKMILDGVTLADGDKATNSSKAGDTITCQYYSADGFYCWSGTVLGGHWTDGN